VYPNLFHVDYSGGLTYGSESTVFYLSLAHLTSAVTEVAVVFLHLLLFLIASALSYGLYLLTPMSPLFEMPTTSESLQAAIIDVILVWIITGGMNTFVSLALATGAVASLYHLGWWYRASPLGQFIVRLPGIRLIPYLHRKYWLPSRVPLHPRPRSFYMKRFIIRQSDFIVVFCNLILLNSVLCSC